MADTYETKILQQITRDSGSQETSFVTNTVSKSVDGLGVSINATNPTFQIDIAPGLCRSTDSEIINNNAIKSSIIDLSQSLKRTLQNSLIVLSSSTI